MKKAILGIKQDMTQLYDEESKRVIPCTILQTPNCVIAGVKTEEKDGYTAIVLGLGRTNKATKSETGKFSALGYTPRYVKEVRVDLVEGVEVGYAVIHLKEPLDGIEFQHYFVSSLEPMQFYHR